VLKFYHAAKRVAAAPHCYKKRRNFCWFTDSARLCRRRSPPCRRWSVLRPLASSVELLPRRGHDFEYRRVAAPNSWASGLQVTECALASQIPAVAACATKSLAGPSSHESLAFLDAAGRNVRDEPGAVVTQLRSFQVFRRLNNALTHRLHLTRRRRQPTSNPPRGFWEQCRFQPPESTVSASTQRSSPRRPVSRSGLPWFHS
jgi:hypothetical protein